MTVKDFIALHNGDWDGMYVFTVFGIKTERGENFYEDRIRDEYDLEELDVELATKTVKSFNFSYEKFDDNIIKIAVLIEIE